MDGIAIVILLVVIVVQLNRVIDLMEKKEK
jgi:hypothetical protein